MTTELTKAAQQALEQLEFLNACYPHKTAADAISALQSALTQRPAAQAGEREAWVPYLVDRADGVKGRYAIGRWNPRGYREVWNLHSHRWAAYSDDVMSLEEADSLLRQITIPTARASLPAPQQATPAQEPGVFREYFDAHRALIAANGVSERASHAHIVGYRAPSHSTGSEPYAASVARNDQLKRADDAARCARKEAEARFSAALSAAQSATQQATPEPLIVKGAMAGMVDAQVRDLWPTKGATPEPAGEPVGTVVHATLNGQAKPWVTVALNQDANLPDGTKLFTHPAPGVPEGFALVPVEPTPEMIRCAEMWDDGFEGAYARVLAAAQAKEADHG